MKRLGSDCSLPAQLLQADQSRGEAGLLGQGRAPLGLGFRQPALFDVDHGQVMPCLVALETGVQTGEMRSLPSFDQPQKGLLRTGKIPVREQSKPLLEEQFAVLAPAGRECMARQREPLGGTHPRRV